MQARMLESFFLPCLLCIRMNMPILGGRCVSTCLQLQCRGHHCHFAAAKRSSQGRLVLQQLISKRYCLPCFLLLTCISTSAAYLHHIRRISARCVLISRALVTTRVARKISIAMASKGHAAHHASACMHPLLSARMTAMLQGPVMYASTLDRACSFVTSAEAAGTTCQRLYP